MTLSTLILYIGIVAVILTLIMGFVKKDKFSWVISFLQNFCGVLFIFSGFVKAVDPLGTAYKMEQYFTAFETTFSETWLSFIAPLFPLMSSMSVSFSVLMIVFEIILGIMLVLGSKKKFTTWSFLGLVAFFTVLTGFTYLTGYVESGVNFFDFGSWGKYKDTNMQVTDCGCFGDFLKLEPKVSFFKDIFLLIPALLFIWKRESMHDFFTAKTRNIVLGVSIVGLLWYCASNYVWDIPANDFRPFKIGADINTVRNAEMDAAAAVQVTGWVLRNKNDESILELSYNEYMSNLASYPKTDWEVIEQIKTEPAIPKTKVSDFEIHDFEGSDYTDKYLENEKYHFMIVSHKSKFTSREESKVRIDSFYLTDTIVGEDGTISYEKRFDRSESKEVKYTDYIWDKDYLNSFTGSLKDFITAAKAQGHEVSIVGGSLSAPSADDFKEDSGLDVEYYTADDILLKTIVRSNPGIVLWKDGKILSKWHQDKLPTFDKVKENYIQ